jgi:hypothetical protein
MKFFAFIMAVTVLALSLMPCMDGTCIKSFKTKAEISKTDTQHEQKDSDDCSPFCTCSCCSASFFHQPLPFYYTPKRIFQTKKYPVYTLSLYSDVSFSIWQPPKLS